MTRSVSHAGEPVGAMIASNCVSDGDFTDRIGMESGPPRSVCELVDPTPMHTLQLCTSDQVLSEAGPYDGEPMRPAKSAHSYSV